jgi:hypothetical protein
MTRKQQYLLRRQRYQDKMRRYAKSVGSTVFVAIGLPRRKKNPRHNSPTGKQGGKSVSPQTNAAEVPGLTHAPPGVVVDGGGWGNPPHQHVDPTWTAPGVPGASNLRALAVYGGHQRRRKYMGHKPGRLDGTGRQFYFANLCYYLNGWFPDWDPLARTPVGPYTLHPTLPRASRVWP